jgi:hypothetical protein
MGEGLVQCRYEYDSGKGEWNRVSDCEPPGNCPSPPQSVNGRQEVTSVEFKDLGPIILEFHPNNAVVLRASGEEILRIVQGPLTSDDRQNAVGNNGTIVTYECHNTVPV